MLAENELPLFESTAAATDIYIYIYIYNSNDAIIISSNKVSKGRNHMNE